MKEKLKLLGYIILIPLLGFVSSLFFEAIDFYAELNRPPLAPPGFLFGVAWTILYGLLGATLYYIIKIKNKRALALYISQMVINFIWSYVFFNFQMYVLAFILIIVIFVLTVLLFIDIREYKFKYLLVPYLLWLIFAGYLNLGIIILN